jgi:hypothetical protein
MENNLNKEIEVLPAEPKIKPAPLPSPIPERLPEEWAVPIPKILPLPKA